MESGLKAVKTADIIKKNLYLLDDIESFFLVGLGKCSFEAAACLEELVSDKIRAGVIIDVHVPRKLKKIEAYKGSHPLATQKNIDFTKKIIDLLKNTKEEDTILMVISGGGSALLCQPENFSCQQEGDIVRCLIDGGATIEEVNVVRKHLSLARGGFLAKYAYPSHVIALIFSDVPGNRIEFVASGPTFKDTTTIEDAKKIIEKYKVKRRCGFEINFLIETPKDDKYFEKVKNIMIASNNDALEAMANYAKTFGYQAKIKTNQLSGEAREVGEKISEEIKKEKSKTVLLYGGETTVRVIGQGKGGRNQELVLSSLRFIDEKELIIAFASDGWDNTDFAGAIADINTLAKAKKLGLNIEQYLAENNSYDFFQKTGDFIKTGPTGANVSDLIIAIHE